MEIIVNDESAVTEQMMDKLREAASACTKLDVEISLSFVSLDEIHELNRDYRGVDRPTDVLSFPMFDDVEELEAACGEYGDEAGDDGQPVPLGDVVICMDKIIEQAEEFSHSRERETVYLFTHSVLHLLGYDHETDEDKREMREREEEIMDAIGLGRDDSGGQTQ